MAADCVKCDWKEYTSRREREIINSKTAPGQYLDEPFPVKKARAEGAVDKEWQPLSIQGGGLCRQRCLRRRHSRNETRMQMAAMQVVAPQ